MALPKDFIQACWLFKLLGNKKLNEVAEAKKEPENETCKDEIY